MKINEYRTNGKAVAYRRDANTLVMWADAESMSTWRPATDAQAEILTHGWRTMQSGEVSLWCAGPKAIDWKARAEKAEAALADVRKAVEASEVKPLPPGTYYTEHVEHATKISEARRLAMVEIRSILGLEPKP